MCVHPYMSRFALVKLIYKITCQNNYFDMFYMGGGKKGVMIFKSHNMTGLIDNFSSKVSSIWCTGLLTCHLIEILFLQHMS